MAVLRELVAKLGLDFDAQSFLKANVAFEALKKAGEAVKEALDLVSEGFEKAIVGTAEQAHKIELLSQETGIGAEKLQEYAYVGGLVHLTIDDMALSMGRLARVVKKASEGSAEASYTLRQVGVRAFDANGHMRSMDDILEDVADKFHGMPNGVNKTALSMELFGRAGKQLIPLLNKGKAGIAELRAEAHELGVVMSDEDIESAADFAGELHRLRSFAEGLFRMIGGPLIKALIPLAKKFIEWAKANKDIIKTRLEQFAKVLIAVLTVLGNIVLWMVENWKLLAIVIGSTVLPVIATLVPEFIAAGAAAVASGVAAAAAWLAAAAPFVAIAVILTAIALAAEDFYQYLTGGKSVIGDLAPAWIAFIDAWLKVGPNDPWWLVILKRGAQILFDITNIDLWRQAIVDIEEQFANLFKWLVDKAGVTGRSLVGSLLGGQLGGLIGAASSGLSAFGGGASPAATAAAAPGQPGTSVLAPFNATIHIHQQPGQSSESLTDQVTSKMDEWWNGKTQEAAGATGG